MPRFFQIRIAAVLAAVFTREISGVLQERKMGAAWFKFINADGSDEDLHERGFVFELNDPLKMDQARRILAGQEKVRIHVAGRIIPRSMPYNPEWSFHLDPASVSFFSRQEHSAFDANMYYVEDHLDQVGGSFLPGRCWCPSDSRLIAEVRPEMD